CRVVEPQARDWPDGQRRDATSDEQRRAFAFRRIPGGGEPPRQPAGHRVRQDAHADDRCQIRAEADLPPLDRRQLREDDRDRDGPQRKHHAADEGEAEQSGFSENESADRRDERHAGEAPEEATPQPQASMHGDDEEGPDDVADGHRARNEAEKILPEPVIQEIEVVEQDEDEDAEREEARGEEEDPEASSQISQPYHGPDGSTRFSSASATRPPKGPRSIRKSTPASAATAAAAASTAG